MTDRLKVLRRYWHPVAWAKDVSERPVASELLSEQLVLWRKHDRLYAAADRCPHRSTALSLGAVDGDTLVCAYHGWRFDSAGKCTEIPQLRDGLPVPERARLQMFACEERYGIVWVALESPARDLPVFPEWGDPSYRHVACAPYTWQTSAGRMVENFTDFGHLGYLHDGLLGTRDDLVVPGHRVRDEGGELHYELTMSVPNTNDRFAVTDVEGNRGLQTNSYVLTLPFTIHLQCHYQDAGSYRTLFFAAQPRNERECTGYCYQSRNFELDGDDEAFASFQELLATQDQPIVEHQPGEVEEVDELHLPFDRVAIAYRRALRELYGDAVPSASARVADRDIEEVGAR